MRLRERPAIELAARGERPLRQDRESGRNHVVGKPLPQMLLQRRGERIAATTVRRRSTEPAPDRTRVIRQLVDGSPAWVDDDGKLSVCVEPAPGHAATGRCDG